jgi:hypothetical protein
MVIGDKDMMILMMMACRTMVSDGSQKLRAALPSSLNSLAEAGQLQERGTLRILDYTFSNVAGKE